MIGAANRVRPGIIALTASLGLVVSAIARPQPSTVAMMLAVSEAQISPDGTSVVFSLGATVPVAAGDAGATIWRVPFAGGDPVRLSGDAVDHAQPRWSPDGQRIAFLARERRGAPARVRLIPSGGGAGAWITNLLTDVSVFGLAPDGSRLAYAGRPVESGATSHLWIQGLSAAAPPPRRVEGVGLVTSLSWAPSGQAVALVERTAASATRVLMVPMSGPARVVYADSSPAADVACSPDGRRVAWLTSGDAGNQNAARVFLAPTDGGPARVLPIAGGGSVRALAWAGADHLSMVLAGNRERHMDVVDVATGTRVTVMPPGIAGIAGAPSWSADGTRYVVAGSGTDHPPEVFAGSLPRRAPSGPDTVGAPPPPVRRITFSNR
ncbi:MAG: hypothetical protein ACRD2I_09225 [Vicinamibacterales bacterium]